MRGRGAGKFKLTDVGSAAVVLGRGEVDDVIGVSVLTASLGPVVNVCMLVALESRVDGWAT